MRRNQKLIGYMQEAVKRLLERDGFENGWKFKKSQREALQAYAKFLDDTSLPLRERMAGYFDIATGAGKTAIFVGLVSMANEIAEERGDEFRSVVVVPTNLLLEQTSDEFNEISPSMDGKIGFYGDGNHTLSKPITIMTYNAWTKLSDEEKLNAQNVDLLISDEAHRGTSKERSLISKIFNGVVRLAFTATPEFDPDKAVEHSHKHEIYKKPLIEAVRDKELAAYIQVQPYVIRARPSKKLKDKFGGEEITGDAKRKLRQDAWTKWAVRFYREGRDRQTDDLVSDNQAGFFVDDIDHAVSLRKALNSDPALKRKAKELGYKDVAVDVHSRALTKGERKKRIKDYEKGRYMAIIGDQMLKEGFDHKQMKTVIDWQHGSLVDKLQILGRGARKWFNKAKKRWEGLTFADTVVYVGSDDPEEDDYLREQALRKAILASDILDGNNLVCDPEFEIEQKRKRKRGKADGYPPVFMDDDDVEEFTTAGEIKTLLAERSTLRRDDYIEVTGKMMDELEAHIKRTSMSADSLINKSRDVPEGLTSGTVRGWIAKTTQSVKEDHWIWVMQRYSKLGGKLTLGDESRQTLSDQFERTGVGSKVLLDTAGTSIPKGLKKSVIDGWKYANNAHYDHWNWVMEEYKKLPNSLKSSVKISKSIERQKKRTGIGSVNLLKNASAPCPKGLTHTMVNSWESQSTKHIKQDHWDWVMEEYKNLPDIVKITPSRRNELKRQKKRTGIGLNELINTARVKPDGLKPSITTKWIVETQSSSTTLERWNWVMDRYESLPDQALRVSASKKGRSPS